MNEVPNLFDAILNEDAKAAIAETRLGLESGAGGFSASANRAVELAKQFKGRA